MKEIKTEYYIKDWAGNYKFNYRTFPSYEDASEFLLTRFPDGFYTYKSSIYEDLQEFYIDKVDDKFTLAKEAYEFMQMLKQEREYTNAWADRVRHLIN